MPVSLLSFYSVNGRAYLFYDVVNVTNGQREHRQMVTGWNTVVDIYCVRCGSLLGWEYATAYEKSQKDKERNFVLERCKVLDPDGHPYVPNQVVHNGQEPEIGQEYEDDEEPEIGQEG
ncbi:unnamed protein product [Dovyalis caffra]|uniref:Protein yippee-like n=1 Tax=Dovyalis caffra TaxID=77055 RepID=A0AAV1R976_9ROSI|nr:unnamed protein product [Dovyalis caffra]